MNDVWTTARELFPWDELADSCRDDPRIRFYVDPEPPRAATANRPVDWLQVLAESSRDRAFRDATALESYAGFASLANASTRARTDFEDYAAEFSPAALRRFLTTKASLLVVAGLALPVSSWPGLALLACQLSALALVPVVGLTWRSSRARRSMPKLLLAVLLLVAGLSLPASAPLFGPVFPFTSILVMGGFLALVWILSLDHAGRPLRRTLKMYLLLPEAPGLENGAERARRHWLEDACENAVMPELIQTINRLLQPRMDKRLLVQDAARLRAIYHAGLLVPTRATHRVQEALRRSDGASIAVSGVRGSGKTTLLRTLCGGESQFSVLVSAPTHYVPKEFLIELFQRLCAAYIIDQGFTVERKFVVKRRKGLLRYLAGVSGLILRVALACALTGLLIWSLTGELAQMAGAAAGFVRDLSAGVRSWSETWWADNRLVVQILLIFLIVTAVPKRHWRRMSWTSEPKLVVEARRHYQRLQAEQTATMQASGSLPVLQTGFQRSIALKSMPWGMPELVGHLCRFLEEVTELEQTRGRKVLICIDEVDRIGSAEEATRFLSEIKAIFGSVHCYFLVAVADELGASFARQVITGRSHVENAFDEKISLEPMSFELGRQLLQRRVPGFTEPFVWLGLVLSGGLPRELIRVARRLVEINIEFEYALRLTDLADRLVREELHEAINSTRGQIGRLPVTPEYGAVLDRLRQLARPLEPDAPLGDLRPALKELAGLSTGQPPKDGPDDLPFRTLVTELSTLAFIGMTVCDAFKDSCFDAMVSQDGTQPATDQYVELAVARRELSISADSCRAAVQRIRLALNLL